MPNYGNPPQQRQNMPMHGEHHEKHHMSEEEMANELKALLDDICTYLYEGVHWHQKAATCARAYVKLRGPGRQHSELALIDFCKLQSIEALSADYLEHAPRIDMEKVGEAEAWMMKDMEAFLKHFPVWINREKHYTHCIKDALHYSGKICPELYAELFCLSDLVRKEIKRVRMLQDRIDGGGRSAHDIYYISETMHEHYEHGVVDKKDPMDVNYG